MVKLTRGKAKLTKQWRQVAAAWSVCEIAQFHTREEENQNKEKVGRRAKVVGHMERESQRYSTREHTHVEVLLSVRVTKTMGKEGKNLHWQTVLAGQTTKPSAWETSPPSTAYSMRSLTALYAVYSYS